MQKPMSKRTAVLILLTGLVGWGTLGMAEAQSAPVITACVDPQGRLRIIPTGGSCGNRETLLTWPAESSGVTYDQHTAAVHLGATIPQPVVVLCDAPDDTATGGGYWWERDPAVSNHSSCWIEASAGCRASGLCGGPAGEDGWVVIAWNCASPTQSPTLHVYVTCWGVR